MAEDRPEDIEPTADSGRAKRAPPTIDLEASEISGETQNAGVDAPPEHAPHEQSVPRPSRAPVFTAIIAAIFGAGAAALVIAAAWIAGWPGEPAPPAVPAAPQLSSAALDDLAARVAGVESKIKAPATPAAPASDPAAAARADALEKSLAALRSEIAGQRAQSEKLAAALNEVTSAPRETPAPVDLSAIDERLAQIERTTRAQNAAIAQDNAKPADDVPLRRIVAAALLDVLVRSGDPYPAELAAAKALAANPDALKPLDGFAASGVPGTAALSRELLTLVPKLSPATPDNTTTGAGLVDRLQAGAAKLVRIERTDTVGTDRGAIVARITAAGLRNNIAEARRELNTLAPADRGAAQAWLDKADARDAALATSRQFAAEAMAALAKPAQ
jgi:hypothetical protein